MESFDLVAMGGTFDIVHKGHMALLSKAFSISSNVIIGLVSDELAAKKGKKPQNDYSQRIILSTICYLLTFIPIFFAGKLLICFPIWNSCMNDLTLLVLRIT